MEKEKQKTISVESIDKVLKYLPIFEKKEYRSKEVNEFVETLYEEGFIIPFDWRKPANQKDYNRRMREFFDHHLRGKPAPIWLKEGISHLKLKDHIKKVTEKK